MVPTALLPPSALVPGPAVFSLPHAADVALTLLTLVVGVAVGGALVLGRAARRRARDATPPGRILVALTGDELPCAAIDAAARLGRADRAVVVPAVLLPTPYGLPLDCPLQEAGSAALDLLEAVERRLTRAGVLVDGRVVQGRTRRHAVRRLVEQERFDRLVVPASDAGEGGFGADDVAWILAHVEGEVLVLRAGPGAPAAAAVSASAATSGTGTAAATPAVPATRAAPAAHR
ncbi:universal stress protein [Patulibacter americanus]|uniref:universal stress protein n=1 Tax=Patulibacter americanus TaxID=588672 RepID=UPI0003B639A2|nr:universal stress protein [Patulibacter americanus]